ncbi:MAG: CRISPR-associated endonuclease Cas2 [Eubacteriales bacterium]|jgi:CRISPR-associated protein Cas2|nr:CRISPR-associated endonuclease Cas2 [Eubacteriales bacterium]NLO58541.1 CRISPR-associated endonuclease Cas2 [Synergistaceae bacterium]
MKQKDYINLVVVYDISGRKVTKAHKRLSENLYWEQKSVFLGETGKGGDRKIMTQISAIIDAKEDSVIMYKLNYPWNASVERWGKKPPSKGIVE